MAQVKFWWAFRSDAVLELSKNEPSGNDAQLSFWDVKSLGGNNFLMLEMIRCNFDSPFFGLDRNFFRWLTWSTLTHHFLFLVWKWLISKNFLAQKFGGWKTIEVNQTSNTTGQQQWRAQNDSTKRSYEGNLISAVATKAWLLAVYTGNYIYYCYPVFVGDDYKYKPWNKTPYKNQAV